MASGHAVAPVAPVERAAGDSGADQSKAVRSDHPFVQLTRAYN
jgi:hypothetical protein